MRYAVQWTVLARALLAGEWREELLLARGIRVLGEEPRWLPEMLRAVAVEFVAGTRPRERELRRFLNRYFMGLTDTEEGVAVEAVPKVEGWLHGEDGDWMAAMPPKWGLRAISHGAELATWLGIGDTELAWFADLQGRNGGRGKLDHYVYRAVEKRSGGTRLIEAPKPRLKAMQRMILTEILDHVPAHKSVHGFVRGRSIQSFAGPHAGKEVVLRLDIEDFFPSISGARVQGVFRALGYREMVADVLGGICTHAAPARYGSYRWPHLPQGAATSPALANLCAFGLDLRLSGLAAAAGGVYTRYADDLAFSGDAEFARAARRFAVHVAAITAEEGWMINHRKTRVMRQGVRQHLAGLTVNAGVRVGRAELERLEATLTNCVRHGAESQNRAKHPRFRQHLEGRISFVASVEPLKGNRLRSLFERIEWPSNLL